MTETENNLQIILTCISSLTYALHVHAPALEPPIRESRNASMSNSLDSVEAAVCMSNSNSASVKLQFNERSTFARSFVSIGPSPAHREKTCLTPCIFALPLGFKASSQLATATTGFTKGSHSSHHDSPPCWQTQLWSARTP